MITIVIEAWAFWLILILLSLWALYGSLPIQRLTAALAFLAWPLINADLVPYGLIGVSGFALFLLLELYRSITDRAH